MTWSSLNRCTKCILPNNFPGITFSQAGVCSYCENGIGIPEKRAGLSLQIKNAKKIVVALSGGRDSCYGLEYLSRHSKAELIAFTYDWPLVNSRARRNASRMVQSLGIEHVLRVPDSFEQIQFIRRIVFAISKKPDAKAIPLLLAPDKFFFLEAARVAKKYNAEIIIFCAGNDLEFTSFKSGIAGAVSMHPNEMLELSRYQSLKLLYSMGLSYLKNPRLFFAGVKLPFLAFIQTYFTRPKIEYLFQHIDWDEDEIETVLKKYDWEGPASASKTNRWRSGDGTADFYNYLYFTLLGYDERTANLANRIRAGLITRDEALKMDRENSKPNLEGLTEYSKTVGFQLDDFLQNFNSNLINNARRHKS
jgi:glucosamine--fructose-6-phosphate aminotransferase (isomerizing)